MRGDIVGIGRTIDEQRVALRLGGEVTVQRRGPQDALGVAFADQPVEDRVELTPRVLAILLDAAALDAKPRASVAITPGYDATKYTLGALCKHGHNYEGTGQSLRRLVDHECLECQRARAQAARQRKRQATGAA